MAAFGYTDFGVVAPVLLASLVTTALVFLFVWRLVSPEAAGWCALLYATEPFNVVNSTTMTNDVILACLTFASLTLFLIADQSAGRGLTLRLFAASGALMVAAFLVKIAMAPVVCGILLYSTVTLRRSPAAAWGHGMFFGTLAAGLFVVSLVYYWKTGDVLWQFKAEAFYYETYKPDWYVSGAIDYAALMWYYPRSLFSLSGLPGFKYLEHGLLFWWFVPASVIVVFWQRNPLLRFLVVLTVIIFAFFQFYPQYLSPRYLPLVRQERYVELLLPGAVIVAGTALHLLHRRRRGLAIGILCVLLGDSAIEAARRSMQYRDSQEDVRALARYAESTLLRAGRPLAVDLPAKNALAFYLQDVPLAMVEVDRSAYRDLRQCYVAVGGARSFWWARDHILDVSAELTPPNWILTYERPAPARAWRSSNLRVYFVSQPSAH